MSTRANPKTSSTARPAACLPFFAHTQTVASTRERFQHDYRPAVYWTVPDAVFANIKGAHRRRIIRQAIARGELDRVPAEMLGDDLPPELRLYVGAIHPSFMGGEY